MTPEERRANLDAQRRAMGLAVVPAETLAEIEARLAAQDAAAHEAKAEPEPREEPAT